MAFVYVSDDMAWGMKNLKNRKDDLFFVGSGGTSFDDVGFDLVNTLFNVSDIKFSIQKASSFKSKNIYTEGLYFKITF